MLLTLLPLAGWAEAVTLLTTTPQARPYDGTAPTITVKATAEGEALVGTWSTEDGVLSNQGVPTEAAGTYEWTQTEGNATATFVITKRQVVYYLTGRTYAVGDAPDITNHYSLASGTFVEGEELADYAEFDFATSGNDALDLDENGRFTTIKTYNITALRVNEVANVHQNYDFRFTSTATIVVTAKSIASFVYNAVENQTYTGSQITFENAPAIYATAADRDAETPIALDPANYDVTYGENINVAYDNNNQVVNGGTIIYTGKGNYEGTLTVPFKIQPRELVEVTVDEIDNQTYAYGEAIVPSLTGKVHGKDAEDNQYTLVPNQDFTVDYGQEANATNINAGDAVGDIAVAFGNFTFANNADVEDVEFTIDPKNLGDEDITVATQYASYPYTGEQIQPVTTVTWTIGEAANNITVKTTPDWTYNANVAVGKGYVKVVPAAVAENEPQNYTGSKIVAFDIIPTDLVSANVTITLQKENPNYNPNDANSQQWIDATYQYEGRDIKPGTKVNDELVDGRLLVKKGETVLEEGVDYEIVADQYGANVTINDNNYTGDNKNASEIANTKGTVTIQGLGNYGAIDALSEPITLSQVFDIAKRTLTFTATPVETTFSVAPTFACTNDAVDDLGGQISYETVQVATYNGTAWGDWSAYNGQLDALEVTAATPVNGSKKYQYKPTWTPTTVAPENPDEDVEYSTAEQVAARANYDIDNVVYKFGAITINNATWIIVPDNASKKYMVADAALVAAGKFTYKVYNGSVAEGNLVENPEFNQGAAPVIGRALTAQGENCVNGGYVISVLNANANVAEGVYGQAQAKVAKTGYTIQCQTATLTIDPFPITLTANDQTIYYGSQPETGVTAESMIQTVNAQGEQVAGDVQTVTFTPVMYGNQTLINRADLGLTLTWDENGEPGEHAEALVPAITNLNFVVTAVNKGTVTVLVSDALILAQDDADLANKIAAADDGENHTISFKSLPMTGGKWHAMVLPFEVSLVDVVSKLGTYVVVNKIKSASKDANNLVTVNFGIEMNKIEAGVPFLIKPADDSNWKQNADAAAITFTAEVEGDVQPQDKTAAIFTGVYETGKSLKWGLETDGVTENADMKYKWLDPSRDTEGAWVRPKNNAHQLSPMEAYLQLAADASGARIFVEDFENGTTAIKSLTADQINGLKTSDGWYTIDGIKLQSAPTEKGVYINNGKKVVLK